MLYMYFMCIVYSLLQWKRMREETKTNFSCIYIRSTTTANNQHECIDAHIYSGCIDMFVVYGWVCVCVLHCAVRPMCVCLLWVHMRVCVCVMSVVVVGAFDAERKTKR